ncbi:uncharacterized protein LOC110722252 [Chenopodium quinoa]|uniref:uncharacterized protein LOC110722252 n=1 Tax=Chenopodium quinoa TaxID=63459 RepID=UPI000B797B1B|nr:uncharacterized protein LOC110722252 [Chenopodium quinoa]
MEDIRENNDIPANSLNELLWKRFGIEMAQSALYRVRAKTLEEIHGGHNMSYKLRPLYCDVIKALNPNSLANCAWNPATRPEIPLAFKSIFISFKAVLDGLFAGCRSIIRVDGTYLKGNYGGVLLVAVALNANNELFPVAWATVEAENTNTWKFFIWHLKNALKDSGKGDEWCIISYMQKGIQAALTDLWPKVGRRYCCKHLVKNFKAEFPGLLMFSLYWKAAGACNHLILLLKRPVLTLFEGIRRLTMVRLATRREQCKSWNDDICPNIIKRLQVVNHESRTSRCLKARAGEYEVLDGKSVFPVNLNDNTCTCNVWQLSGFPCKNGMRAIIHAHEDPKKFVSERYSLRRYKMVYANTIKSIPDVEQWPENNFGRPARNRRREEGGLTGKEKTYMAANAGQQNKKHSPKSKPKGVSLSLPEPTTTIALTKGLSLSQPDPTTIASTSQPVRRSPRTKKGVSASQPV